jgi:predicted Zn-dependent protease
VNIGPEGLVFQKPATLRLSYPDSDQDGLVDGTTMDEKDLLIFSSDGNFEQFDIRGNVTDTVSNFSEAAVPHLTSFGFWSGRWPSDSPLRYKIVNTPVQTDASPTEIKHAIRSAFSEWQTDLSSVGIYFEEVAVGEEAEISLEWTSQALGGAGLTTGYLASTSPTEIHKRIQLSDDLAGCCDADIWSASLDPSDSPPNAIFVKEVAMHEVGHALGLAHLTHAEQKMADADVSVMHAAAGVSNLQALSPIDLQKLRDRYGISVASEIWQLQFEGTLVLPNNDYFGLDGAIFTLTMEIDPKSIGTHHDIYGYLLSGYRTTDYSLMIDGHGYSLNSSAAALIWDSKTGSIRDRLSIHADITDTNEVIPFDFGGDMFFSLPGIYLPSVQFSGTDLQPVANADVMGVWPATVWRILPTGGIERTVIGVKNTLVSLCLEKR